MAQQVVVGQQRQVVELEVVDIHGEALLDLLADVAVHHGIGLARAGGPQHHCRPEGIDDVNHSRPPLAPVVVAGRKVDRVFVFEQTRLLLEALVVLVEGVAGKGRMQQAADPHPGGQQCKVAAQQGQYIAPETKLQPRGKAPQRIVAEEQEETRKSQEEDLPFRGFPVPHAACAVAPQHQKEEGAEFRDGRPGEEPGRLLKVPENSVHDGSGQRMVREPVVTEPVTVQPQKHDSQGPGKLDDLLQCPQIILLLHTCRFKDGKITKE